MNKPSIRTFVLAAAISAVAGGALGSAAAFADETGAAPSVPAGQTVCVDLPTSGTSGHALGSSDLPLNYTLLVQDDGASGFALVARSEGPTNQWRAELPAVTGYVVRTVRACAQNPGNGDSGAFLTIETDDTPVVAAAADADVQVADVPAPAVVDDAGLDTPSPAADAVQSVVDRVEALVADIAAAAIG